MIILLKSTEGEIAVVTSHSESPRSVANVAHVLTDVSSDFSALGAVQKLAAAKFKAVSVELRPEAPNSCELDSIPMWSGLDASQALKEEFVLPVVFLKNCAELKVTSPDCLFAVSACECGKPKGRASELAQLIVEALATRKNLLTLI